MVTNRYPMIEKATRNVLKRLGIEILEMEDATCCPAPGVFKSVDKVLWLTFGARNIIIAEQKNTDILTVCSLCYGTLVEVDYKLKNDADLKNRINNVLGSAGLRYLGISKIRHIVELLYFDFGINQIRRLIKRPLGLKVAVHYGCQLVKPSNLRPFGNNTESPHFLDDIIEVLGCKSVDYKYKMQCCGAGGGIRSSMKKVSLQFVYDKLDQIRKAKADCIVVACPFCHLQFDLGQIEVREIAPKDEPPFDIPVFYITQLLGLAMGMDPIELGLIKPKELSEISPFIEFDQILEKIPKFPS